MSEIQRARPKVDGGDTKFEPILYLDGVSVAFDGFKALNELSFYVEPGELRAIIGPNGAGKTTMMDVITGKTQPDSGTVLFHGDVDLTKMDEAAIATLGSAASSKSRPSSKSTPSSKTWNWRSPATVRRGPPCSSASRTTS